MKVNAILNLKRRRSIVFHSREMRSVLQVMEKERLLWTPGFNIGHFELSSDPNEWYIYVNLNEIDWSSLQEELYKSDINCMCY